MEEKKKTEIEAGVFEKLIRHLRKNEGDYDYRVCFGLNNLSEWYRYAAKKKKITMNEDEADRKIYSMHYKRWLLINDSNYITMEEGDECARSIGITKKNEREIFRSSTKSEKEFNPAISQLVFLKVVRWFRKRTNIQNIDLMERHKFCRNCLSKWYMAFAKKRGIKLDYEEARKIIYGMAYEKWKKKYQKPLSEDE